MGLRRFLCSCLIFVLFRTQAWRRFQNANICAVDWRKFAGQDYKTAMLKLYRVGNTMAQMVRWLESYRGFGRGNMVLVGYSLGAHAAGYAGSLLNGQIGEIIGLDPAGPLFTFPYDIGRKYRLDESDARFVQVMHTSAGTLGTVKKCGHADFYPNGGASPQSNCLYPANTNENNKSSLAVSWEDWWTYDGISGPAFWGLINPEWSLCNKGRRQSPVNLEPQRLLFDPNLRPLHIDKHRISGTIMNTGHSVIFTADNETTMIYDGLQTPVNITGGPLSYRYRFHEIHIHYGLHDQFGSEHSVEGYTFPAEIQIFGYNSQLYSNFSDSLNRAQGIVGVAILLQLGDLSNAELRMLTDQLDRIKFGGDESPVRRLSVRGLLPDTDHYMTYEGSTTSPACHETVTWIVLNKPIYITKQQLFALRRLMQGGPDHPKAPVGNNFRPPQPLLHRPIRTNIDFRTKQNGKACPSMYRDVHYKANSWKQH